nr:tol-Pal system protein TolA-like [Aegilops tauschii subsp. strangulata]
MERNAREAQEEREAAAREEADTQATASVQTGAQAAAMARAEAATKAQAEANAKAAEDPTGSGIPEAASLEQPEPLVVEAQAPPGAVGAYQMASEREVTDSIVLEAEVTQHASGAGEQSGGCLEGPEMPLASAGLVTSQAMTARSLLRPHQARAASEPRPVETGAASPLGADTGATSSAPPGWTSGASTLP